MLKRYLKNWHRIIEDDVSTKFGATFGHSKDSSLLPRCEHMHNGDEFPVFGVIFEIPSESALVGKNWLGNNRSK